MLEKIYKEFTVDPSQTDAPDFGIILKNGDRIGIEITCYDDENCLEYENFTLKGYDSNEEFERMMELRDSTNEPENPPIIPKLKEQTVFFYPTEIANRLIKNKGNKYDIYLGKGFKDVILLAHSNFFSGRNKFKIENSKEVGTIIDDFPLIEYILCEANKKGEFSYKQVLFISVLCGDVLPVYTRGVSSENYIKPPKEKLERQETESEDSYSITISQGKMVPMGKTVKLEILNPDIPPKYLPKNRRKKT